jgi:hypothetical protein
MKTPAAPAPPDPAKTAGAQTATNIGTAIANANLQSVDQVTPYGSLSFDQTGMYEYTDPNTGDVHEIPRFTATQSLSPEMQTIFNAQTKAQGNMANLAADTSGLLKDHFAKGLDLSSLPAGGSAASLSAPDLKKSPGYTPLMTGFAPAGQIVTSVKDRTSELQRSVGGQTYQTEFGDAGPITRGYETDFSEGRKRVEDALFSRLNPSLERDKEALRTQLVGQGIREGSEAYDRAMNRLDEKSNDARMQVVLAGGQEQSRLAGLARDHAVFENAAQGQDYNQQLGRGQFSNTAKKTQFDTDLAQGAFTNAATGQAASMDIARGEFANKAQQQQHNQNMDRATFANKGIAANNAERQQQFATDNSVAQQAFGNQLTLQGRKDADRSTALQEMLTVRNQPINQIGALLGTGQVTQPNFINPNIGAIAGTDRAGLEHATYEGKLKAWEQQVGAKSALMGSLFGAGGSIGAAMLSDRRTKTDVEHIGNYRSLPVYSFRYTGDDTPQVGFMADEVMRIAPEAISFLEGGIMAVNYSLAMEAA